MKPPTNESPAGGACLSQPVRPSPLEQFHAWMMAKKHEYQVEKGSWREAGDTGMQTRAEGKAAAMYEALRELERMMAMPNAAPSDSGRETQPTKSNAD